MPGLFGAFQKSELCDLPQPTLLQKIIAKANHIEDIQSDSIINPDQYLTDYALAFYESNIADPQIATVYAEPLNLEIKSDHITAYPVALESEDLDRINNIVDQFNKYFSIDGLLLSYQANGRLICKSSLHELPQLQPVYSIYDRDIKHFLPNGPDAKFWLRIFNEMQMFFHEYIPVEERRFSGCLLNGFWFWGGGKGKVEISSGRKIEGVVIGESGWLRGYCNYHSITQCGISDISTTDESIFTIFDERLLYPSSCGDFELWSKHLKEIDTEIVEPLVDLLNANKIKNINIVESDKSIYQYKKNHRLRFFKRAKTFAELCLK